MSGFGHRFSETGTISFGKQVTAPERHFVPAFFGKKFAVFNCNGGGKTDKFFQTFIDELKGNELIGKISFKDPLKDGTEGNLKLAEEWIKKVIGEV